MSTAISTYKVTWLPGDGIGRDVTREALRVIDAISEPLRFELAVEEHPVGGAAIDLTGEPLPDTTRDACLDADAVLLGAVGGPKWDDLTGEKRPESGLLALRKALQAFANLRPVSVPSALVEASPLRAERVVGTDMLVVRELTGGIYFGEPRHQLKWSASNSMRYQRHEVERIARVVFEQAKRRSGRVTSVDKANVLDVSRFWRDIVSEIQRDEYPEIDLNHLYVDNAAMQLVIDPGQFDVVLTANLFGDILSDLAAALPGSLGLLPSASIGGAVGLFEPVHGSAPQLVGQDVANPIAAILSAAMLLEELGEVRGAEAVRAAVADVLAEGHRTADLAAEGRSAIGTEEMGGLIAQSAAENVPSEVPA